MAGVLACGREPRDEGGDEGAKILDHWGAAVSHRSAAQLWRLLKSLSGPIDISVPGDGAKRKRSGIRVHRSRTLLSAHVTLRNGIPVTTPARTIADLRRVVSKPGKAGLISPPELRRAIRQAEVHGLPLGDDVESDRTRSDLESDFLGLCRGHRLPMPEVNVRIGPHLVDFLWRDRRLIVETDGYAYHGGRISFQDDRRRDLDLRARGFQVIRLAEKQVNEEPQRVAEVVSAALRVGADGRGSEDREESWGGDG
jgi:very-short-patch-repair endonuclease